MLPPCMARWVATEHGTLRKLAFPGASVPRDWDRNYEISYDLASEIRQYSFCHILFITSESQESAQIQGKETKQGHEY